MLSSFFREEAGTYIRLTAAIDTTTRAAHDFDELILGRTIADLIKQDWRTSYRKRSRHSRLCAVDVLIAAFAIPASCPRTSGESRFLSYSSAPVSLEVNSTQSSFHYTTGHTEDNAGTGVITHDVLDPSLHLCRRLKMIPVRLDQSCQFACCDNRIDIINTVDLELLLCLSNFLATHGMTDTTNTSLGSYRSAAAQ